jgi:uncharacterized protein YecE (DUF72 family)
MTRILLGTSGWSYKDWIGILYENDSENKLLKYSSIFDTAEIDSTFYSYPSEKVIKYLINYTREDFIFTAKIPKIITHKKKLDINQGIEEDLLKFCDLMKPLQKTEKLGCLLFQLPPKLDLNLDKFEKFLKILPNEFRYAIEFRNEKWLKDEVFKILKDYDIAYTIVDEPLLPSIVKITTDFTYIRWHGRGKKPWYNYHYKEEELKDWIPKIKDMQGKVEKVYGFFNNHFHGYAVHNCLQMLEMLNASTNKQKELKEKLDKYLEFKKEEVYAPKITSFTSAFSKEDLEKMKFDELLGILIDKARIRKTNEIMNEDVKIIRMENDLIEALVKEYHITIDLNKKIILHDCADWSRVSQSKMFCKHIGKLFILLPKGKAEEILRKIIFNIGEFKFLPLIYEK